MPRSLFVQRKRLRFALGIPAVLGAGAIILFVLRTRESSTPTVPIPPGDAVARVGSTFVTQPQLQEAMLRRHHGPSMEADRNAALEDQIRRSLLFAEAERSGFTRQPELQNAWRSLVIRRFEESLEVRKETETAVTEAEIAAHYQAHPDAFATPERRRFALIHLPVPAGADDNRLRALEAECRSLHERALAEAAVPASFGTLAKRYSGHLASRQMGGEVGWLQRSQALRAWPTAVVDAAFALGHDGEISAPIATDEGWYLLKRLEVRPAEPLPLDNVRDQIRRQLTTARIADLEASQLAKLRALHGVEIYPDRVADVKVPAPKTSRSLAQQPPLQPAH